jgi:hypothetical protein
VVADVVDFRLREQAFQAFAGPSLALGFSRVQQGQRGRAALVQPMPEPMQIWMNVHGVTPTLCFPNTHYIVDGPPFITLKRVEHVMSHNIS